MLLIFAASVLAAAVPPDTDDAVHTSRPTVTATGPRKADSVQPDDDDEKPNAAASSKSAKPDTGDADEDEKGQQTGAIVVTARRLDTARSSIDQGLGATVYELHNETIENRPGGETGTIGAILTQTPGVTLSSSGINVRGSKAVQVRINGVVIPEAITDPEDRLSSRLAESTRLITGTLPAQFGFAPAGVIAVTTKNGLYQHGGQAELFAGSHDAFEPAFEWGTSSESSSLFASGSLESGATRVAGTTGPTADDVRHEIGGLAFADHVIDQEDRVSLILGGSRESRRIGQTDLPRGVEQTSSAYAVGTYQHSTNDLTVQASLFAGHGSNSADFFRRQAEASNSVGTQIDSSLQTGTGNTVRAGLLLSHSTDRNETARAVTERQHRTSLGAYLQDEWKPDAHLTLNAGIRGDWLRTPNSSPALEPRASIVWSASNGFTAHAGYARYASAPPLGEDRPAIHLPNESDDYFDAGVQQKLGPVTVGLDGYYRSVHNLIVEHKTIAEATPTAFAFGRGRFKGLEFSATYARGPVTAWANLTVSKSQGRSIVGGTGLFSAATVAAVNGHWVDLASDRPVSASAGASWRIGKLDLSGDILAGSGAVRTLDPSRPNGSRAPAFATLGLAAVYHLTLFDQPLDVRADLTNLTNVRYVTNDAANLEGDWIQFAEGRSILVGFEQAF